MVKKINSFLYFLAFSSLISLSQAQTLIGLRAGANLSKIKFDYDGEYTRSFKPGIDFAVLFNIPLKSSFSVQLEPGFSSLGTKYEIIETRSFASEVQKDIEQGIVFLSYLNLPVVVQYKYKIGRVEPIFSLGPEIRLLTRPMNVKISDVTYTGPGPGWESIDNEIYGGDDGIRKLDYGVVAGLGVRIPVKDMKFFCEARYHYGFANITSPLDETSSASNIYGSVNFGVLIPFVK